MPGLIPIAASVLGRETRWVSGSRKAVTIAAAGDRALHILDPKVGEGILRMTIASSLTLRRGGAGRRRDPLETTLPSSLAGGIDAPRTCSRAVPPPGR